MSFIRKDNNLIKLINSLLVIVFLQLFLLSFLLDFCFLKYVSILIRLGFGCSGRLFLASFWWTIAKHATPVEKLAPAVCKNY